MKFKSCLKAIWNYANFMINTGLDR